ncbi:MAG TPA: c-type cytochrome [Gammaproteobacteria bacterium]|nr:c-type cytochrome [Gammaproteobacteria bacterium]
MNKFVMMAVAIGVLAFTGNVNADGNATAGQAKAAVCAACHGADGNSVNPRFPKLAGQNAAYIVQELERFKSGYRKNIIMSGMAAGLSDQDMQNLAAWFSSQTLKTGEANPSLVKAGEALYRGGDQASGIPACLACHSPDGAGNGPYPIPALAGQHADYVVTQLQAFASGTRISPMMNPIASRLTPAQMKAVASYIQGLHSTTIQP